MQATRQLHLFDDKLKKLLIRVYIIVFIIISVHIINFFLFRHNIRIFYSVIFNYVHSNIFS
jgi:hypothetical protein